MTRAGSKIAGGGARHRRARNSTTRKRSARSSRRSKEPRDGKLTQQRSGHRSSRRCARSTPRHTGRYTPDQIEYYELVRHLPATGHTAETKRLFSPDGVVHLCRDRNRAAQDRGPRFRPACLFRHAGRPRRPARSATKSSASTASPIAPIGLVQGRTEPRSRCRSGARPMPSRSASRCRFCASSRRHVPRRHPHQRAHDREGRPPHRPTCGSGPMPRAACTA